MSTNIIHVIGMTKPNDNKQQLVYAMNKMEMAQQKRIMEKEGKPIVEWYAQTRTGCKMLGGTLPYSVIDDRAIIHANLIVCPICNGIGKKQIQTETAGLPMFRSCPVCNGSGITKRGYWKHWREWQIESFKKDFAEGRE